MKGLNLTRCIVAISILSVVTVYAQSRGTPSQIRVRVDANGALVTATASQVNPVSSVLFNNARLAVDASGNLLTVVSGGAGVGTVTQIDTTSPITGGPITTTGTIACATCGVTGNPLSQFASTTSAQLAGVLSNETGLGAAGVAVFSESPTFINNINTANVTGGLAVGSSLTLQSTSAIGTTDSIRLVVGNNGGTEAAKFFNTGVSTFGLPCSASGCDTVPSFGFQFTGTNIAFDRFSTGTGGALFLGRHARGTVTSPTQTLSGDNLTNLIGRGWETTTPAWTTATNAALILQAAENFTSTAQGTRIIFQNTPLTTTTAQDAMTINGTFWTSPLSYLNGTASTSVNYGTQPTNQMHMVGTSGAVITGDHITADAVPFALIGRKARGTVNVPTQALSGDNLVQLIGQGWETTTPGWSSAANGVIGIQATENFTSAAQGTRFVVNLTPTGSVTAARFMTGSAAGIVMSQVSGTAMAVANVGANSCGTTTATIAGNQTVGEVTVGATSGTQCRVTVPQAVTTRFNGSCMNQTTANPCRLVAVSTTTFDLTGTFVAGDVIAYIVMGR